MQFAAGGAVVAEVGEGAGVGVKLIGPVRFGPGRVEHDQPDLVPGSLAHRAEPALVAHPGQEPGQRIVRRVPRGPALVDPVYDEVAAAELIKSDRLNNIHQASVSSPGMPQGRSPQGLMSIKGDKRSRSQSGGCKPAG